MPIRLLLVGLLLATAAMAAPEQWLQYDGTFYDVTFPAGQRIVKTLRVEVYVPAPILNAPSPGPSGTIRIVDPQGKQPPLEYRIRNAYVSSDKSLYLATRDKSALVLHLPGRPTPAASGVNVPTEGLLLFSDRDSARTVTGTLHLPPPPRRR